MIFLKRSFSQEKLLFIWYSSIISKTIFDGIRMLNKTKSMKKNIQQSLEQLGYRKTLTRTTILRALESFNRPVSVEDLVEKCQDLNLTTIYRNLHVMEEHGLIRSMQFTSKAKHYVIAEQDDTKHYHYIRCLHCQKMEQIDFCVLEKIKVSTNFTIVNHSMEFTGYCPECVPESLELTSTHTH